MLTRQVEIIKISTQGRTITTPDTRSRLKEAVKSEIGQAERSRNDLLNVVLNLMDRVEMLESRPCQCRELTTE